MISDVNGRWGSVLSKYGQRVVICEAHGSAGGAAHGFSCKLPKEGGSQFCTFWGNILLLFVVVVVDLETSLIDGFLV